MHESKIKKINQFHVWGTGTPLREFLFVDDLANAIIFLMNNKITSGIYNVGSNNETSITDLTNLIKKHIGYQGEILFDHSKPDGNPRKLLDSSKLFNLGWKPKYSLDEGIGLTYSWYKKFSLKNVPKLVLKDCFQLKLFLFLLVLNRFQPFS